ncbi:cellulose biosynthesis protein BcsR [Halomonas sp. HP20-15]|uniref:cellulose biosynthesis protein BcsR n=1 Tax=Halomonas sp. HP20-15 TaxID=3085901 RepID=UPI002980C8CE|nr:cellulose biosynthesis protein BcsR [Halomonas sp. HP20-15]MDW5377125.1 cellulose biosynthesis protein BcsR [Halomonas sp. HP20-15]
MSLQDLIAPRLPPAQSKPDDDIRALVDNAGLGDFPYRNIHQQERLAADLERWPLLRELAGSPAETTA